MKWPILNQEPNIPADGMRGSFAFKRSFYYHSGVDLYCPEGQPIIAIEGGKVIHFEIFTGDNAIPASPWWNETSAVMIEGKSGCIGYCEIALNPLIKIGMQVKAGDILGHVVPILKKDKGNGTTMLHFELYAPGSNEFVTWEIDKDRPSTLQDPTELLKTIKNNY